MSPDCVVCGAPLFGHDFIVVQPDGGRHVDCIRMAAPPRRSLEAQVETSEQRLTRLRAMNERARRQSERGQRLIERIASSGRCCRFGCTCVAEDQ